MKINFFKNANYFGGIIIVLAFAILYFSYFLFYIPQQENRLQQRAFRILKEYGKNMFGKNYYYKNHFENYKLYYSIRYFTKSNEIEPVKVSESSDREKFKEIEDVINGLDKYVNCQKHTGNKADSSFIFSKQENKLFLNYGTQLKQQVDASLNNSIKEIGHFYRLVLPDSVKGRQNTPEQFLDFFKTNDLQYKVPIDKLMEGLKFDRLFENIVLFESFPGILQFETRTGN